MSINKKLKKLTRNPKLFFTDMYLKYHKRLAILTLKKYHSDKNYTIVSAVYNVEEYLNDYFVSLTRQKLDFKNNIFLILVDDGSTDHSAEIIHRWQKKYPNNIRYIYKKNGGQASARNLGLEYVKTEWISFIDPDDFVSVDYFSKIDTYLDENPLIKLVCCNLIFYFELNKQYKDTHPLRFKFKENKIISYSDLTITLQLSASSALFSTEIIRKYKLLFDERVKPVYEDAKFISYYLSYVKNEYIAFLKDAKYFYRKRVDGSSSLDQAWMDKRNFLDVFEYGLLETIEFYKQNNKGIVPKYLQNKNLYHIIWYIKRILIQPHALSHLTENEKNIFFSHIQNVFDSIDEETILAFNLAGTWFFHKVGLLGLYKKSTEYKQRVYVERIDKIKNEIEVVFFSYFYSSLSLFVDGKEILPIYKKRISHRIDKLLFSYEYRLWFAVPQTGQILSILIDGKSVYITINKKAYENRVCYKQISELFNYKKPLQHWVLMDRISQADDNAEHLYRYIQKNHPEQKIYFALDKQGFDWQRLSQDNFNLVVFGSSHHKELLRTCSKIISSHADKYVNNYLEDNLMLEKDFVFLQHGVTKDDLSNWLNPKSNMKLFITSTKNEYNSIAKKNSNYIFTDKETILTGLPRHDALLKNNDSTQKIILIMPTWRRSLVEDYDHNIKNFSRTNNCDFIDSQFAQAWESFLNHPDLASLSNRFGYKVIFAPHKNMEVYLDDFKLSNYISTWKSGDNEGMSIQELFKQATFMITDYSSVAFEMGLLNKTVIYYQFDENNFFEDNHTYQKGYFDYRTQGFGPVVNEENDLMLALEQLLQNKGKAYEPYSSRMLNTFPYRDGKNCERVYNTIKMLDNPNSKPIDANILMSSISNNAKLKKWDLVEKRTWELLAIGNKKQKEVAMIYLIRAYYYQHEFNACYKLVATLPNQIVAREFNIMLAMLQGQWIKAKKFLKQKKHKKIIDYFYQEICNINACLPSDVDINSLKLHEHEKMIFDVLNLIHSGDFIIAIEKLENILSVENLSWHFLVDFKLELILSELYRKTTHYQHAEQQLLNFEKHTKNDIYRHMQIAHLNFELENYSKVVKQLDIVFKGDSQFMPFDILNIYTISLKKQGTI